MTPYSPTSPTAIKIVYSNSLSGNRKICFVLPPTNEGSAEYQTELDLLRDKDHVDVEFKVEDLHFMAHRFVLSRFSSVFADLFKSGTHSKVFFYFIFLSFLLFSIIFIFFLFYSKLALAASRLITVLPAFFIWSCIIFIVASTFLCAQPARRSRSTFESSTLI